jgi:hypothetical protein
VHRLRLHARSPPPFTVNLPLARAVDEDVLLVHTWERKPLAYLLCFPPSNGGRN